MRGLIKGTFALFIVSIIFAFMHSCTLDNHILKPSCLVFEIDLDEKWWYPEENTSYKPVFFGSNGYVKTEGQTDSVTFAIQNCNKIIVTDLLAYKEEQWVIKRITQEELYLAHPNDVLVKYKRK